jgi:hypothetical protein
MRTRNSRHSTIFPWKFGFLYATSIIQSSPHLHFYALQTPDIIGPLASWGVDAEHEKNGKRISFLQKKIKVTSLQKSSKNLRLIQSFTV